MKIAPLAGTAAQQRHRRSGTYAVALAIIIIAPLFLLAWWPSSVAFSTSRFTLQRGVHDVRSSTPGLPTAAFKSGAAWRSTIGPGSRPIIRGGGRQATGQGASKQPGSGHKAGWSYGEFSDLFLQLPFNNGVWLQGFTTSGPQLPLLPPQSQAMPPLTLVPVTDAGAKDCVPFDRATTDLDNAKGNEAVDKLKRRLAPGPLQPSTVTGRALHKALRESSEQFPLFWDYELLRAALSAETSPVAEAESLVLSVYARFLEHGDGAPPRPSSMRAGDYDAYAKAFGNSASVAVKALERTMSRDFIVIAKAHVLGLARGAGFPSLPRSEARALYANALRFGHALRQAETRFRVDGAAGTFVPLSVETQLLREELEELWARESDSGETSDAVDEPELASAAATSLAVGDAARPRHQAESDAEAAQRSLREVRARLRRIGEVQPRLATYLDWLGQYDPEALSMLVLPSPPVALAMRMQLSAVWGEPGAGDDEEVATTPFDAIEALVFGAWLRDAGVASEETLHKHQQRVEEDEGAFDAQ